MTSSEWLFFSCDVGSVSMVPYGFIFYDDDAKAIKMWEPSDNTQRVGSGGTGLVEDLDRWTWEGSCQPRSATDSDACTLLFC